MWTYDEDTHEFEIPGRDLPLVIKTDITVHDEDQYWQLEGLGEYTRSIPANAPMYVDRTHGEIRANRNNNPPYYWEDDEREIGGWSWSCYETDNDHGIYFDRRTGWLHIGPNTRARVAHPNNHAEQTRYVLLQKEDNDWTLWGLLNNVDLWMDIEETLGPWDMDNPEYGTVILERGLPRAGRDRLPYFHCPDLADVDEEYWQADLKSRYIISHEVNEQQAWYGQVRARVLYPDNEAWPDDTYDEELILIGSSTWDEDAEEIARARQRLVKHITDELLPELIAQQEEHFGAGVITA